MSVQIERENINRLVEHFEDGCKANCIQKLGVEIEHFIVERSTGKTVSYYGENGIESILKKMICYFPKKEIYNQRHLIGMYNNDYSISIEPAGQIEISITPRGHIQTISKLYDNFIKLIHPILEELDYELVTLGYHPVSRAGDMELIPKKRYEYMDRYFQTSGTCGFHMMRGTAATQVSIDFFSEEDFVQKYRAAYQLMPIMKLMTDNTPYFDGEVYKKHLARTYIWDNVDPLRCGIPDNLFSESFGFESYANYLWNLPMIFIPQGNGAVYTKEQTATELWADRLMDADDIDHVLSMTFLDVRLKHYIEIRVADSMPKEYVMGYVALIKGLFFNTKILNEISQNLPNSVEAIKEAQKEIENMGYEAKIYGMKARDFMKQLLDAATEELDAAEREYLNIFDVPVLEAYGINWRNYDNTK